MNRSPESNESQRMVLLGIVIIGFLIGSFFVAPEIDKSGALISRLFWGMIIGATLIYIVSSKARKRLLEFRKGTEIKMFGGKSMKIDFYLFLTHPTQRPMIIGMAWFLGVISLIYTLPSLFTLFQDKSDLLLFLLLPCLFLIGLSGFLMIVRKEGVNGFGQIYHGFRAYFNGILGIIFGWGGGTLLLLATILHW